MLWLWMEESAPYIRIRVHTSDQPSIGALQSSEASVPATSWLQMILR